MRCRGERDLMGAVGDGVAAQISGEVMGGDEVMAERARAGSG